MQLNRRSGADNLRAGLMAATCALLAPAARAQTAAADADATKVDAGILYYQEDQGRIRSMDAIVKLNHDFGDERTLGLTASVDSLSGGSPNGAVAQKFAQTFTTPSGSATGGEPGEDDEEGKEYRVAPGHQPLDPSFRDLRVAGDVSWSQPLGIGNRMALGGHLSVEHDFVSGSGNLLFSHDFNRKNTTLGAAFSAEFDQIKPVGGAPVAGSDYSALDKGGNETKRVMGAQLGVTQVLARNWVAQLNFSADQARGYLNDPYKIVSQVDATGVTTGYRFESRPDSRLRRSVYFGNKLALGRSVLDLSYRYGSDDWGIRSHTVEAQYRLRIGGSMYLEPQLRWYKQGAADFYRLYLTGTESSSAYMSADPRLGAFTARTVGLKLGVPLSSGNELGIRLEGYQQDAKDRHSALAGMSGLDLNPRLRALVLQFDLRFGL
jgi:hypothetical protein